MSVLVVNIERCEAPKWGPDRLGATETIAPDGERSWQFDYRLLRHPGEVEQRQPGVLGENAVAGGTVTVTATTFAPAIVSAAELSAAASK